MSADGQKLTLTADGNTQVFRVSGELYLHLSGTFGGGTAKLQRDDTTGTWVDVAEGSFTEATDSLFKFPRGRSIDCRVNLAGSTTPSLNVIVTSERA